MSDDSDYEREFQHIEMMQVALQKDKDKNDILPALMSIKSNDIKEEKDE